MTEFTPEQIRWYRAFVRVQRSGKHNMVSRAARDAAGLTDEQMKFVMRNYEALGAASNKAQDAAR